jgi:hypothetical protein
MAWLDVFINAPAAVTGIEKWSLVMFAKKKSDLWIIASEDLEHHTGVFGTASKNIDVSPVGCVKRGVFPESYLDKFTPDSIYYEQILEWKTKQLKSEMQ